MIRIYPTTTFMVNENNERRPYQVVTLSEYLYDQDIDQFYVKKIIIINKENQRLELDPQDAPTTYLGYDQDSKDLTLILRKDASTQSWLKNVNKIEFEYKENIPNWDENEF